MPDVDRPNIVLTGFMGTGKSVVGRRLATVTGRDFVDTDAEIVARHGSIENIFSRDGEDHFRELERAVVAEIAPRRNLVIATGGGTMLDSENVLALMGTEIFTLTATPDEIMRRVSEDGLDTRPLLGDADDPAEVVASLLSERSEEYDRFTSVETTGKTVDEVIDALREAGASVASEDEVIAEAVTARSAGEFAVTAIIAVAVAVLIVVIVLVMTF